MLMLVVHFANMLDIPNNNDDEDDYDDDYNNSNDDDDDDDDDDTRSSVYTGFFSTAFLYNFKYGIVLISILLDIGAVSLISGGYRFIYKYDAGSFLI